MYCISIQIRPKDARDFNRDAFLDRVRDIRSPEIDAYEEKGKLLLSFNFFTEFATPLWDQLQLALFDDSEFSKEFAAQCLILCEDEETEAAYLLHHYDSNESLDTLPT